MENKPKLFCSPGEPGSAYENIRMGNNPRFRAAYDDCKKMWDVYWPYADDNFVSDFRIQFYPRWFEMYLTVSLKEAGINITKTQSQAPDVFAEINGRKVWIEAVCVTSGQTGRPNSIPDEQLNVCCPTPVRQFTIRTLSALDQKCKQLKRYIEKGIVSADDILIVAISYCQFVNDRYQMVEWICRSVYGEGDLTLKIGKDVNCQTIFTEMTSQQVSTVLKHPHTHNQESGSATPLSVEHFIDGSMPWVAAIIGSSADPGQNIERRGNDFVIFPSLTSDKPLFDFNLPFGKRFVFDEHDEGWLGVLSACCRS